MHLPQTQTSELCVILAPQATQHGNWSWADSMKDHLHPFGSFFYLSPEMAFPNLLDKPKAFLNHLKAINLNIGLVSFQHYQCQPKDQSNGWLDESMAMDWCRKMNEQLVCTSSPYAHIQFIPPKHHLQGKLSCMLCSQSEHHAVLSSLNELCIKTIIDVKGQLSMQTAADTAARA